MSLDLFRNQSDNNSKSIPIQWLGATRENLTIPEWLSGVYLQIGPGCFDINVKGEAASKQFSQSLVQLKIFHFKHWFDGLSFIHKFEFQGGSKVALWNHTKIAKKYEKKISETATIDHTTFGPIEIENHEVSNTVIDAFKTQSVPNDNDYINQEAYNNNLGIQTINYDDKDHIIITGYSSIVEEVNPLDFELSKVGNLIHSSFYPSSHYIYTPFKRYDPKTNELFSLVLEVGKVSSTFHVVCTSFPIGSHPERTEPETILFSSIPNVRVGYVHSFALTPHFIVIFNCPYHAGTLGSGLKFSLNQGSIQKTMKFSDQLDENSICYIISRNTGNLVKTFESAGFFYLNIINSFEEEVYISKTADIVSSDGDKRYNIYVDVVGYTNSYILDVFNIDELRTPSQESNTSKKTIWSNTLRRYCLPSVSCYQNVESNSSSANYWEQVVKDKVESPSWFVNSLVKPFKKIYYTATGTPEPPEENTKTNSNNNINNKKLSTSTDLSGSKNSSYNNLSNNLNQSDLDVRFEYPASFEHLCNITLEFPCINANYNYKEYRYVYGLFHPKIERAFFTHLIKIDTHTMKVIKFNPSNVTAEPYEEEGDIIYSMMNETVDVIPAGCPTFVPKVSTVFTNSKDDGKKFADDEDEDEGAIIAPFFDKLNKRSILFIINAKTFKEIGRFNLPSNVFMPFGSQGTFCNLTFNNELIE
ncbi:hypothetical protein H8356DRAFT_1052035 [Neocallimastix lanati (nom. inval.)]|jgi:carotenoid cleavage dioxygenase-like enzyme|nr:hypothetical protein H8356DRAFT_1052035 [Neocallimastix sp. JGI-2020a]